MPYLAKSSNKRRNFVSVYNDGGHDATWLAQHPISRRRILAGAAASGLVALLHPFSLRASSTQVHLRLMETTDLHAHVFPWDYYDDQPDDTMGLARTAAIINAIRAEATNTLLIDNGDFLQGSPMGDYMAYEHGMKDGDLHPIIAAMNVLGYDCSTLGNHEFNYGLDYLFKALDGATFPFVCANVTKGELAFSPRDDDLFLKPYQIIDKQVQTGDGSEHLVRIGLIGFVPPQIMEWDADLLRGKAKTRDIVDTARAYVPEMQEQGADIIVALSHSGIGSATHSVGMENASLSLASVDGIDALLTGHSHRVFPGPTFRGLEAIDAIGGTLHGKPAVMSGYWGSHLGLIDLMLEHDGARWTVADYDTEARPIAERVEQQVKPLVESDETVVAATREWHDATLAYVRKPVGTTSVPLHSYFSLVSDGPLLQLINKVQIWYTRAMLADSPWKALPIISAAAPFKAGGHDGPGYYTDVAVGDIAIKDIADLYLYPNTVRALFMNGAEVREWLEMSAGTYNTIEPGASDAMLISPDYPSYNFDVIDGVSYEIDVSKPPRYSAGGELVNPDSSRIINLAYDDKPIDDHQLFIVATNNYRAGGGGNFPNITDKKIVFVAPDTSRDTIMRYIVKRGTINTRADANWKLAALPNTTVLFDTGPASRQHLDSLEGLNIEAYGDGDDGFARFRIAL